MENCFTKLKGGEGRGIYVKYDKLVTEWIRFNVFLRLDYNWFISNSSHYTQYILHNFLPIST